MTEINNYDDHIDSRDVQERIDKLDALTNGGEKEPTALHAAYKELATLNALKAEYVNAFGEDNWNFGAQFIRDSYFEDYAQEFAEDCGMVQEGAQWPNTCIDWEQAANELKMDYTEVDFDGTTYWTQEA